MTELNQRLQQMEDRLLLLEGQIRVANEDFDALLLVLTYLLESLPDNEGILFLCQQIEQLGGALPVSHPLLELYESLCQRGDAREQQQQLLRKKP